MFTFLSPTALFAAFAALIPLIIHLFSRRRVKVVEFSSIRHLKSMQKRQVRRLKIRQLLLLILRMLLILSIVLAFARPTSTEGQVGAHASVSAVVLFDNSASMSRLVADGNLFELAKRRTEELLHTFGQSDEVALIALDNSTGDQSPLAFSSSAIALEQLAALPAGNGSAQTQTALEAAVRLLDRAANLNHEIYVVSDRQRHTLPERPTLAESNAKLFVVDLPLEGTDDVGIVSLDFGGQLLQPGREFELVATLKNYGDEQQSDLLASLFLDGRRVSQTSVSIAPNGEAAARFAYTVSQTGFHSGYVELADDKLAADNRQYFSFRIPDQFNVLVVNGDESGRFISLALTPTQELSQYWSVKQSSPDELSGINFDDYSVVILAGAPKLDNQYVERLKQFVQRGRSLFLTYGAGADISTQNRDWAEISKVTYEEAAPPVITRAGYYSIGSIDLKHPVFAVFKFAADKPPDVKFYSLPRLRVENGSQIIMRFSGDRPALVESRYGRGKVLTFAGPMGVDYSDLVTQGFFVPFISRVVEYLAADLSSLDVRQYVGENATRSLTLTQAVSGPVDLIAPDSSVYSVPPEEKGGALVVHASPTPTSGIYSLRYEGKEIDRFAVNVAPAECDLVAADIDEFSQSLGAGKYNLLKTGEAMAGVIAGFRVGRELWQIFLWIAVILLIAEMILGRTQPAEVE